MRLLLVEDDPHLGRFIQKGLQEERYAVDLATDGEEGLCLATVNQYDLIILDIMLPKLDGFGVCRKLRADRKTTPILMLTAREAVEDRVAGLDTGADDYLTKLPSGRLKALDLELDPVSHRVWRAGQEIPLTNKEFALLEYLLRSANQVLTRTAIIEHVWDIHYDSMTNIVDVHIRALRSKIDRNFSPPLIHTVRGVGYVLKTEED